MRLYLRWILGALAVSQNVLRGGTPVPPRISTPIRSFSLSSAPDALSMARTLPMDEPAAESEPLVILQVLAKDLTRRLHLLLGDRAMPFFVVVLFVSLCGTPR